MTLLQPFYTVRDIPIFQNKMFNSREEALACPTGDIELVRDPDTGLIFNQQFNADKLNYDSDYQNDQSLSAVFRAHLADVMDVINRFFKGKSLIEVGCGKGYFVNDLMLLGYNIIGIDPAFEGESQHIIKSRFESTLGIEADGLILRHVLEHISNPVSFLKQLCGANRNKGLIYIEVPCFDWIISKKAWYDIFYEHCNYFRRQDFVNMFSNIYDLGTLFGDQYLYVVADLASLRSRQGVDADEFLFVNDIGSSLDKLAEFAQNANGKKIVWGGAAKGMMFCFEMMRKGVPIDEVIDINPSKQGKFLAGSGLQVMAPNESIKNLSSKDTIFVTNPLYHDEIVHLTKNNCNYVSLDEFINL